MQRAGAQKGDVGPVRAQRGHRLFALEHPVHRQPLAAGQHRPQLRRFGQGQENVQRMRDHRQRPGHAVGAQQLGQRQRGAAAVDEQRLMWLHQAGGGAGDGLLGRGHHRGSLLRGHHAGVQRHRAAMRLLHQATGRQLPQVAADGVVGHAVLGGQRGHFHAAAAFQQLGHALLALLHEAGQVLGRAHGVCGIVR